MWAIAITHSPRWGRPSGPALIPRERFGERVLGTASGVVFFLSCNGMGLGSWAGGVIHDAFGPYQWVPLGLLTIGAMAVLLAVTLRPPAPPRGARRAGRLV